MGLTQLLGNGSVGARTGSIGLTRAVMLLTQGLDDARAAKRQQGLQPVEDRLNRLKLQNAELQNEQLQRESQYGKGLTQAFYDSAETAPHEYSGKEFTPIEGGEGLKDITGLDENSFLGRAYQAAAKSGDMQKVQQIAKMRDRAKHEGFDILLEGVLAGDPRSAAIEANKRGTLRIDPDSINYDRNSKVVTWRTPDGKDREASIYDLAALAGKDLKKDQNLKRYEYKDGVVFDTVSGGTELRYPDRKKSVTASQEATNNEIDAARRRLGKISRSDVIRKSQQYDPNTGAENPAFDPFVSRLVKKATERKIGDDPEFEKIYSRFYGSDESQSDNSGRYPWQEDAQQSRQAMPAQGQSPFPDYPEAKQARDGNWYIQRDDGYYRVNP